MLVIIAPAFPFQHDVDSAVAIVYAGFGYLTDTQSQRAVVCRKEPRLLFSAKQTCLSLAPWRVCNPDPHFHQYGRSEAVGSPLDRIYPAHERKTAKPWLMISGTTSASTRFRVSFVTVSIYQFIGDTWQPIMIEMEYYSGRSQIFCHHAQVANGYLIVSISLRQVV